MNARALIWFPLALAVSGEALAAEPHCDTRDEILKVIRGKHNETQRAIMLQGPRPVEVYASETGSWTIIVTLTDGRTCVLGHGDNYRAVSGPVGVPS